MSEKLIDYIITCGATRSEATMIVDLAKHAAEESLETISRVAQRGPTLLVQQATFSAALRFLQVNIGEAMGDVQDKTRARDYPTEDAYMAACRAAHWRDAQLRAHGVEPIDLTKVEDLTHYPPEGFDFAAAEARG